MITKLRVITLDIVQKAIVQVERELEEYRKELAAAQEVFQQELERNGSKLAANRPPSEYYLTIRIEMCERYLVKMKRIVEGTDPLPSLEGSVVLQQKLGDLSKQAEVLRKELRTEEEIFLVLQTKISMGLL